jgi:tyrosine-protein phosphatase YwqE
MNLLSLFKKQVQVSEDVLLVDMHSHILPGIDDGAADEDDSMRLIKELSALGYKKLIATPHIMGDFFKNTPEIINSKLELIRKKIKEENIEIEIDAAAEYYLDEWFMKMLDEASVLLTFGKNFLLFETSYINEPSYLAEAIFKIKTLGYKPVLAHPERYTYLYSDFKNFEKLYEKEVLFQININSLTGYYSKPAQKFAEKLIEKNMVDFIGTDCHAVRHIEAMRKSRKSKIYSKVLLNSKLLNNSLLG